MAIAGARPGAAWQVLGPLVLLLTGTSVAVMAQAINLEMPTDPSAQLLVFSRYAFSFVASLGAYNAERRAPGGGRQAPRRQPAAPTPRLRLLLLAMGLLDLASYSIFNLGFAWCGSALATVVLAAAGQLATALLSVAALGRRLGRRHVAAVAIATAGMALRSAEDVLAGGGGGGGGGAAAPPSRALLGVGCVVASALLFSVLGCLYEVLMGDRQEVTQAQASFVVTGVCLASTAAHQLTYVLPRWHELVAGPLAASGHGAAAVVAAHVGYGLTTAAHNYAQVRLLGSHGAMAVGLVNAVRSSVVSVVASALWCRCCVPALCLTRWKAASALVVTAGAVLWVLAGKPAAASRAACAPPPPAAPKED